MREILLGICPYAIWCIVVCEAVIAALLLALWLGKKQPVSLLALFVTLGLILDAVIIGLGAFLQTETLHAVSPVRFIAHEGACTILELREIAGVIRFASGETTPKWADMISSILSFGTVIPMMIVGVIVWIRQKTPHLFLSGFFMFLFSALGPATGNADLIFFISMFGELFMVLFLYLYARGRSDPER